MNKFYKSVSLLCLVTLLGCAVPGTRVRPDALQQPRTYSTHIPQSEKTAFSDALKFPVASHKGKSGVRILETGNQSLNARLALIRLADKSIDLQYYAVASDKSSNLLTEALIRAAQRGVRVRFLVDGFTSGKMEEFFLALDGMKNIEIRVFNPISTADESLLAKTIGLFADMPQNNKRMHNKALIADNQLAIMGGRNLSDEYFEADSDVDFKDIDILTAGPVTDELSTSFDKYWNDSNSFPISTVFHPSQTREFVSNLRQKLHDNWNKESNDPAHQKVLTTALPEFLDQSHLKLIWADAKLAADDPRKIERPENPSQSKPLNEILKLIQNAHHEFIIISAYFVPEDAGVKWLSELEAKGIHVRVLTNSLASTDVVAVHSGYAPYRPALLQNGIELYELMPVDQKKAKQRLFARSAPPRAGLHSKAYVIDGHDTIIGSFNLDPRSVELNTEMALVVHSDEIAAQMQNLFARETDPKYSYQLTVDKDNKVTWHGIEKNIPMKYETEPHGGLWRGFQNKLISLLPVEDDL